MNWISRILWVVGIFVVILLVILFQEKQVEKNIIKSYQNTESNKLYDIKDSLEIFRLNEIPYGLVIYIQGYPNTLDTTLVGPYQYRFYEVAILNVPTFSIYKIKVPVYAIMMFTLGKESKPNPNNKKEDNLFDQRKNKRNS
jgi:hypothetical protein